MTSGTFRSHRMLSSIKVAGRFPRILPSFRHVQAHRPVQVARSFSCSGLEIQGLLGRHASQQFNRLRTLSKNTPCIWPSSRGLQTSSIYYDEIHTVQTPPFAESVSEGDVRWEKAVGDYVKEDDVVGEIETDKTSIPVPSPVSGVIVEFLAGDGDTVVAGQELFRVQLSGEAPPKAASPDTPKADTPKEAPSAPPPPPPPSPPPPPPPTAVAGSIPTTPPPVPPMPTAPMTSKPAASVTPIVAPASGAMPGVSARTEQRVKMSRMRQRIAQRLKEAQNTAAMLTTFNEIDMSNIIAMRKQHREDFLKKHNIKLGFMSAFIKASAHALGTMPAVNAVIDDAEIVYRDYIDISVAVATPKGLVVPVLRDVGGLNYADIEKALNEIGEKARTGSLAVEDMDGGTFTISNGGVFGSMFGTPIINPPQSAILGMHATADRPVAIDGKVEIRPMMYVALTYDHRLIDGREAVTFLKKIKAAVEDPRVLLLDL
ncbi:dihydrolipoyllysine-residue succinyltransferase component of 2-oxoglutarate dehydrogenase complex, mitochondrial-like isoform X2 [Patiria miniata]|uniref:Dihydrolipoyllysine-residue succinyltransferase component of 2-oxoglutarate dehydrogenase complex, mitochondrial n=1 Tax=Patiria miniata TaxID=46514 RepID=A0A914BP69_PATMI|nr:dihydrolipoyllysine-residue succinyltransferase component of 2-oxoglutarate dehydrogenase complex, mitochondrial-like isoform X2 [Patiria miniata]